jgi:hypothetical protein
MFRLFGLVLVGLVLSGCAEYVAFEVALAAANAAKSSSVKTSSDTSKTNRPTESHLPSVSHLKNEALCTGRNADYFKSKFVNWQDYQKAYNLEIRSRNLNCSIYDEPFEYDLATFSNERLCNWATDNNFWLTSHKDQQFVQEAKRRGLSCGVVVGNTTSNSSIANLDDTTLCSIAQTKGGGNWSYVTKRYVEEVKRRGLNCELDRTVSSSFFANMDNDYICMIATSHRNWSKVHTQYVIEAKSRGLSCGVTEASTTQIASSTTTQSNTPTSAELLAAQRKAEELEQQLAALKAQQEQQQQTISSDKQKPVINIAGTAMNGPQGTIKGYVRDNTGIAEVRVDGQLVEVDSYGNFMANTYVPDGGINVSIEAIDLAGLSSSMSVRLDRLASNTAPTITFDRLNPLGRKVSSNSNSLALIIGVDSYKSTPARAMYADSDAKVFADYASQKLGIPTNRIKTLVNDGAGERELLLSVKSWLSRSVKQNQSDVYIFFAGHGLASDDGSKMYLLPYDGAPELLDDTAISRERLFADISAANPRSVTVFLDTCYSGTTRGTDMLIASRPIAIRALEQSIPDNFTVMTAAAGDQTAKPLIEAKHGMFSYFLMKGMEGEADANNDNEITAGELHSYVQTNVIQQSSGSQTPELQGDADRVLVRFQ